jgi:hypothetical protein
MPINSHPRPLREMTRAECLIEANRVYKSKVRTGEPLWRKRLPAWLTRFERAIVVELLPTLVLRVRDPKNGQILAESEPGKLDVLNASVFGLRSLL